MKKLEIAKTAYERYKEMLQKEEQLNKKLMEKAQEVLKVEDSEDLDKAFEEMCQIKRELRYVEQSVNMQARVIVEYAFG